MNFSQDIKNLAIALEALSRIPNSQELSEQIQENLTYTIHEFEQVRRDRKKLAATEPETNDDDIPF